MSDYKRLVSYMYNYENGIKSNNIGYARVESRNGQCKVTIRIKLPNINEENHKVFFFKRKGYTIEGILLGEMPVRRGLGQFKKLTDSNNIMGSAYSLDDIGGIVIYHSDKRYFATEWDDKPVTKEMVNLNLIMHEKSQEIELEKVSKAVETLIPIDDAKSDKVAKAEEVASSEKMIELVEKIDQDIEVEEDIDIDAEEENDQDIEVEENNQDIEAEENDLNIEEGLYIDAEEENDQDLEVEKGRVQDAEVTEKKDIDQDDKSEEELDNNREVESDKVIELEDIQLEEARDSEKTAKSMDKIETHKSSIESVKQGPFNPRKNQGRSLFEEHPDALKIYNKYPKMYPFEDNELAWCVRFEPQDIGILPIDNWKLANNSFLLHGFYCYSHLIFARINGKGGIQYILGVPGIYHNREKFMAQMFGFNFFKGIKRKELRTGEFGYWYTPIYFN